MTSNTIFIQKMILLTTFSVDQSYEINIIYISDFAMKIVYNANFNTCINIEFNE